MHIDTKKRHKKIKRDKKDIKNHKETKRDKKDIKRH